MTFFATTPFSMERVVRNELEHLGIPVTSSSEGKVFFEGDAFILARACVNLRCADRVFRLIAQFDACSFDELFDNTVRLPWTDLLSRDARIHVSASCARSRLMSVPDVQRIAKKAIVSSMQKKYRVLPETGEEYPIDVQIHSDRVILALDCCGTGLHKRGYRVKNAAAPLRETFAAGLLELAGFHGQTPLCDPFCGSGTLAVEAALKAARIAPGVERRFAGESFFDKNAFKLAREEAKQNERKPLYPIFASDISPEMVEMSRFHAERANVKDAITFSVCAAGDSLPQAEAGILIGNPPYGERLGDRNSMHELYAQIRTLLLSYRNWNRFLLSGAPRFEEEIGLHADKARRFFNGNIECRFYAFPRR